MKTKIIITIEAITIAILVGTVIFLTISDKADIKGLEDKVNFLENALAQKNLEYEGLSEITNSLTEQYDGIDNLIKACIQSSNDMNASYNLLKKEYESLAIQYYSSDDDFLEKENEILRKEIELYKQSEKQ